jgi:serine/threonine protein phosphatase PrpC
MGTTLALTGSHSSRPDLQLRQAAADLLALALDGGAPDNITCIVADIDT